LPFRIFQPKQARAAAGDEDDDFDDAVGQEAVAKDPGAGGEGGAAVTAEELLRKVPAGAAAQMQAVHGILDDQLRSRDRTLFSKVRDSI